MQTDTNESYRSSPGNSRLPNGTTPFMTKPRVLADGDQLATPIPTDGEVAVEYNFRVEYKPGKLNVLADALSRRPDYELAHITRVTTDLYDRIRMAYRNDESLASLV
ncbi:hypothetical protein PC129_g8031 [Phytophthora cactorum]|uniref:Reverse transcriptase RNase H-like domain-containing protein n=1 Tax=Phytophthora cactorum TaxID=29920 RepID=A0A8T1A967_9STRA|nr:hypothetical protein PC111_g24739 [Phytophthora cactorum]KAG2799363.1 hypothetical protein PC113_g24815 [Phytophthora cactorum]KAG2867393.1 hypothetical protein PC114_g27878 [Phytophthora cactorum]KAG2871019.1 hypothetical protein PC115_g24951 [Phytophthora cactorum]KAG2873853.1 hypothetical protein PC117_g27720 [Phytophthora cactorum]